MAADRKKRSNWAESLAKEGLLGEIEDGWTIPEGTPIDSATIAVDDGGSGDVLGDADSSAPQSQFDRAWSDGDESSPEAGECQLSDDSLTDEPSKKEPLSSVVPRMPSATQTMIGMPTAPLSAAKNLLPATPVRSSPPNRDAQALNIQNSTPPIVDAIRSPRQEMGDHYDLGDFSGALTIAEEILRENPNDTEATNIAQDCRRELMQIYESRIGAFDHIPQIAISEHDLVWRELNPAVGFVLSRVDGYSTYEDIVDIAGMPRFETCRILGWLLQEGIIE